MTSLQDDAVAENVLKFAQALAADGATIDQINSVMPKIIVAARLITADEVLDRTVADGQDATHAIRRLRTERERAETLLGSGGSDDLPA